MEMPRGSNTTTNKKTQFRRIAAFRSTKENCSLFTEEDHKSVKLTSMHIPVLGFQSNKTSLIKNVLTN